MQMIIKSQNGYWTNIYIIKNLAVSLNDDFREHTVTPSPEVHMIPPEVLLKNIHLIPQDQIVQWHYL